ncbi:MAG: tripartite tricarboxylate transporter substrate binding protein [Burkholderiales bacterium]|nr:tripartite tricarboxylate transporter substrate binding protein [Burkholderiales bacterium]
MNAQRVFISIILGIAAGATAAQNDYPNRPVRMVVPFPAGGPTDIVARPLAQKLSESLGYQVIVDNRGGAGGVIGADNVAKSAPDGYTMLMGTVGTQAINVNLYQKLPYDPLKDLLPVTLVAAAPVALVAHPSVPAGSVRDLLALAKSKPGALTFGSAGSGSPGHLSGEIFKSMTGAPIMHVPYKGSAPAVQDLVGGQITLMFDPVQSVLTYVKSGRIKAIAVSGAKRSKVLPEVPTIAEAGVPGYETTAWWGVAVPAKTPDAIVKRLHAEIVKALAVPAVHGRMQEIGIEPIGAGPAEFAAFQKTEIAKWGKAVRESGAKVD